MLFIFHGPDRGLAEYLLQVRSRGQAVLLRTAVLEDALQAARSASLDGMRGLVVVWDVPLDRKRLELIRLHGGELWHDLAIYAPSVEGLFQAPYVTWYSVAPSRAELSSYVREWAKSQGIALAADAWEELLRGRPTFQEAIGEVGKAALWCAEGQPVDAQALAAVRFRLEEESIFHFVDAVLARDTSEALRSLDQLLASGESAVRIAQSLTRQWRVLTLLKGGLEPPKEMRAHPYVIQKLRRLAARWSMAELRQGFRHLLRLDARLKSGRPAHASFVVCVYDLLRSSPG